MRSIVHGSVLAVEGHEGREALSFLLSDYIRRSRGQTAFTELRNMADLQALQPVLTQQGFAFEEHLNYLIDLDRSQDEIFGGIGARTRKNIKRAQKKDLVKIETVCEDRALDECYAILERTYRKASVPFADHSLFKAALDVLLPKNMIRISLARVNGEPAATSLDLLYKDTIFGWYGGVDRGHRMFVPNEVLTWEILKWGSANGYRVYDFGGAGQPDQKYGVRDFKAKFGGRLVAFGRNRCIHWPIRYRSISFLYGHLRPLVFR
jgi:lipid II:glycine glycyltransferase (peptidoglycan interpeptide bridge formation enzyme)